LYISLMGHKYEIMDEKLFLLILAVKATSNKQQCLSGARTNI